MLFLSLAAGDANAAMIDVTGFGHHTTSFAGSQNADVQILGSPELKSIVVQGAQQGALINGVELQASVLGFGTAAFGTLSGEVQTQAKSTFGSIFNARADGRIELSFSETALVHSSMLPIGTPVTLNFSGVLEGFAMLSGPDVTLYRDNSAVADLRVEVRDVTSGAFNARLGFINTESLLQPGAFTLATEIGRTLQLSGSLILFAGTRIENGGFDQKIERSAQLIASQTAHLFYVPNGDIGLLSESGHNYLAPVPEPSAAVLLLCEFAIAWPSILLRRRLFGFSDAANGREG
jgi:hypothetical protein